MCVLLEYIVSTATQCVHDKCFYVCWTDNILCNIFLTVAFTGWRTADNCTWHSSDGGATAAVVGLPGTRNAWDWCMCNCVMSSYNQAWGQSINSWVLLLFLPFEVVKVKYFEVLHMTACIKLSMNTILLVYLYHHSWPTIPVRNQHLQSTPCLLNYTLRFRRIQIWATTLNNVFDHVSKCYNITLLHITMSILQHTVF